MPCECVQHYMSLHVQVTQRIKDIMNSLMDEKEQFEEQLTKQKRQLTMMYEQTIERKNITIRQLSTTVHSLNLMLKEAKEESMRLQTEVQMKGWEVEDLRKSKDAEIQVLKNKLASINQRKQLWIDQTMASLPSVQRNLLSCTSKQLSDVLSPSGSVSHSLFSEVKKLLHRVSSNASLQQHNQFVNKPTNHSVMPVGDLAIADQSDVQRPFTTPRKMQRRTSVILNRVVSHSKEKNTKRVPVAPLRYVLQTNKENAAPLTINKNTRRRIKQLKRLSSIVAE